MEKINLKDINVLVTGGCGFIGSNFCVNNSHLFNKMVILDCLNYAGNLKNINEIIDNENVIFLNKDIITTDFLELFEKYDIDLIINYAAQTHVDNSYHYINSFLKDNVLSITVILEALRFYNKKIKMIHFSTDEIYGESLEDVVFTEESKFNPTNPYSATKASTEMIINSYKISFKMQILIVRCNNVFGIKQYHEKVIPLFISKALKDQELTIHGSGEKVRDFIHTNDVNDAVLKLIEKGDFNGIYNIGIENPINILELAKYIIQSVGKGKIKYIKDRPFNDTRYNVNFDKLKNLGWSPKNNFYERLDEIIEWEKNNTIKKESLSPVVNKLGNYIDNRGFNMKLKTDIIICEQFISQSKKNVLRGIHKSPYEKYVTVLSGKIIDYIIDFADDKITYKKYVLDSRENNHIFIPANKGHLFISLEDDTTLLYQLGGKYDVNNDVNINYNDPYINLDIPWNNKYILSDKDTNSKFIKEVDYVLMGSRGFLGGEIEKYLESQNKRFVVLDTRLNNYDEIKHKLNLYKPKYVICAAGISGKPTISWCDNNKEETFNVNVIDTLKLCEITNKLNIHLTILGSGSVFNGLFDDKNQPKLIKYSEKSVIEKNNSKYYLKCRNILEDSLELYSNVLYLRIQYPVALTQNPKCFMNKMLTRLDSVHDQYVNITYLPNLFPLLISTILEKNIRGILNFVNPEPIKLSVLLDWYKKNYKKDIEYNIMKSSSFCGLLNTDLLENILGDKVLSIKKIFKV